MLSLIAELILAIHSDFSLAERKRICNKGEFFIVDRKFTMFTLSERSATSWTKIVSFSQMTSRALSLPYIAPAVIRKNEDSNIDDITKQHQRHATCSPIGSSRCCVIGLLAVFFKANQDI